MLSIWCIFIVSTIFFIEIPYFICGTCFIKLMFYAGIFCQNAETMLGFAILLVKIKNKTETNSMFPIDRLLVQKHHRQAKSYDTNNMDAVNSNRKLGL